MTIDYTNLIGMFLSAVGASVLTRIFTIRARVRQEKADAAKKETEVKADQIENIEKMMEKAYTPIINGLTEQVNNLQAKVDRLEKEKDEKDQRIEELENEVRQLRAAMREINPDSIPSRRGVNGKSAPRNPDGTFARGGDEAQG